ncbi:DUF3575 domain-containing protein [Bacteroides sp.]|uniref:DUF3575 domain-containing protein n=1 Tax=Bacteroides sp. TaxID=29523 RepID=UPI00261437A4|nr:DUF3575 domain-containing protein [Bacteroides sp.]MDD3036570.1 DUF3575 domain-containing protein [Bacteroides sp.]
MKHGVYILAFLGILLNQSEGYASVSSIAVVKDTTFQVVVYFSENESRIDSCYRSNGRAIALLDSLFDSNSGTDSVVLIKGEAFASPDGECNGNIDLSARRGNSVKELLQNRYPSIDKEKIDFLAKGEDWTGFRRLVSADLNLPDREEVLMLIDYHKEDMMKRKQLLRKLDRGIPYRSIVYDVLPELRRVAIAVVRKLPSKEKNTFKPATSTSELFVSTQGEEFLDGNPNKTVAEISCKSSCKDTGEEVEVSVKSKTILAIKNNLLYDLVLAPNLEIEIPIGKRWSLNTEYKCPWWLNTKHEFCYQLLSGGVEGRYWLGNRRERNRLTGHFLGLYAEGGIYDFQFRGDGYQGKYYGAAGVTYGYTKQLARHFSLEFSLGIGYLATEYKKYTPYEGDIVWMNSGRYHFIGPTKAKVSLVWVIATSR